jgi:hypothetical protein
MKAYHIGLLKRGKTLVIQAVKDKDCLDCEIYDYLGKFNMTKAKLKQSRYPLLGIMQLRNPRVYGNLTYAVVE